MYEGAESLLQHLYKYLNKTSRKFVTILVISHQQRYTHLLSNQLIINVTFHNNEAIKYICAYRSGSWDEDDCDFHLNQHHLDTEEVR